MGIPTYTSTVLSPVFLAEFYKKTADHNDRQLVQNDYPFLFGYTEFDAVAAFFSANANKVIAYGQR